MAVLNALGDALAMAGSMTWQITWSLILGFILSAVIQAVVRRETISRMLGDDRPATLAKATGLGAASSSCSYAAVALARSLFRKGSSFTAAMVFEIASTNLVIELGIILALLLGWQFTLTEFIGGPVMILLLALVFRFFVRKQLIDAARDQADKGLAGSMEGQAAMDMSVGGEGSFARRLLSAKGLTSVSHIFVMEWAAVLPRHHHRPADRRRRGSLGVDVVLADAVLDRPPGGLEGVGTDHRACHRRVELRLLHWERAARRSAVERWHQLR
jgi:uncharacterized membrane protein YraQ (UPF0718 family)